jgi:signal transduction histidine kinase
MASTAAPDRRVHARTNPGRYATLPVAAATFGASILIMAHGGHLGSHAGPGTLDGLSVGLAAASALPLLAWRRWPLGVFIVCGAANIVLAAAVYPISMPIGPAVALYLVAATRDQTTPSLRRVTTAAVILLLGYLAAAAFTEGTFPGAELVHGTLLWSVAWFAGERSRLRREHIEELKHEARRERELAAAEERARIARDLHDSAGHAINVIAVQAGAARLRHHEQPDRSFAALVAIEDLARRTAADIDHIVGALRDHRTDGHVETPPGLASLNTLIAQHTAAGLAVASTTSGTPRPLSGPVDQAAYRILQEALTNASRHGAPGPVTVAVDFCDTTVELRVTNLARPSRGTPQHGAGHGLVGMRERAALLGGNCEAARANGAFTVHARLPYAPTQL